MALEDILQKIGSSARAEALKIMEEAKVEERKTLAEWKKKGEEEAQNILRKADMEADRLLRQAESEARLEAGKSLLSLKRSWLVKVTEAAGQRLTKEDPEIYRDVLSAMTEKYLHKEATGVIFSRDDIAMKAAENFRKSTKLKVKIAKPDEEPQGGMIILQGPISMNLSFSRLLEDISDRNQVGLHKIIFGDSGE